MHRQEEAGAQLFHQLDGLQTLLRLLRHRLFVLHQQVGIGLVVRAADAATQLVQLGEAELFRAVDQDGIGVRVVDAGLDDGRTQQQVGALAGEIAHHALQLALIHLAVADNDACFRHQLFQLLAHVVDGVDLVVQEIHLPAALQFAQHGFADDAVGEFADEGLDRQTLLRRGGDHRKVAEAFHRHRQRARDRRRGQRQDINFGAHRLQRFLLAHAETVLLVDDDQAQSVELDVLADQLVRADDDVDLAFRQLLQGLCRFLGGLETRDFGNFHWPVSEAVGEGLVMLFAEQGGRAEYRHLLAAGHRAEGCSQRYLGLAKADIATDQPVHRLAGFHVLDHRRDGLRLIGGFLEAKTIGKGFVVGFLEIEGMALAGSAGGIERQQLGRGVTRLLGSLALGLFPLAGAERVQRCGVGICAGVTRNDVQLRHRHKELGLARVVQFEEFLLAEAEIHAHQPLIAADAMAFMNDRVADLELGEILQPVVEGCLARGFAAGAARAAGEQFGFGDKGEAGKGKAGLQGADAERQPDIAVDKCSRVGTGGNAQAMFGEHRGQRFAAAGTFGHQQHAARVVSEKALERAERLVASAVNGDIGQKPGRAVGGFAGGMADFGRNSESTVALGRGEELLVGEEKLIRRQQWPRLVALQQVVARAGVAPEGGDRRRGVAVRDQQRILGQVIEERRHLVEEQRQVILDTGAGNALRNVPVDAGFGRVALEHLAEHLPEMRAPLVIHREFARWQQTDFRHRVNGALGIDVEGLDALDFVIEEIEPVRHRRAHRKKVDQPAADRIFARRHHLSDVRVAGQRHLTAEFLGINGFALFEGEGIGRHEGRRRQPVNRGRGRHQQDVQFALHHRPQRRQTFRHQILVRRKMVVGQGFPVRQLAHAQIRRKPRDFFQQPLRIRRAGRHDSQQATAIARRQFHQRQRIGRAGQWR